MKTKIHLIAIFLLLGIYAGKAQEWGYVNTLTGEYMRKIWTQGLDTVYIVGENGLIARSTDQGETWEKQHFLTGIALNDIIFIDYYTGFAVGEQGAILKTTDAGETWKQISITSTSNLNAIAATGLDNIWAVGDNSLILHSTDSGETWEQENILSVTNIQLTDIAFRGNLGYFTGNYGTIYKTENYGVTWNKQTLVEQADSDISNTFYAINIMENKIYMIYHTIVSYSLFYTENQIDWNNYEVGDGNYGQIALFFLDDNQGYRSNTFNGLTTGNSSIDDNGYIPNIMTTTMGEQEGSWYNMDWDWQSIIQGQYPNNSQYLDIRFVNDTLGYAIFRQTLLKYPKPIIYGKINHLEDKSKLELFQLSQKDLLIKSQYNSIKAIDIFDISGKQYANVKWQNPLNEIIISIYNIPMGIYIIKSIYDNNTVSIEKFLRK